MLPMARSCPWQADSQFGVGDECETEESMAGGFDSPMAAQGGSRVRQESRADEQLAEADGGAPASATPGDQGSFLRRSWEILTMKPSDAAASIGKSGKRGWPWLRSILVSGMLSFIGVSILTLVYTLADESDYAIVLGSFGAEAVRARAMGVRGCGHASGEESGPRCLPCSLLLRTACCTLPDRCLGITYAAPPEAADHRTSTACGLHSMRCACAVRCDVLFAASPPVGTPMGRALLALLAAAQRHRWSRHRPRGRPRLSGGAQGIVRRRGAASSRNLTTEVTEPGTLPRLPSLRSCFLMVPWLAHVLTRR